MKLKYLIIIFSTSFFSVCASANSLYIYCNTNEIVEIFDTTHDGNGIIYTADLRSDYRLLSCKVTPLTTANELSISCESNYKAWNEDLKKYDEINLYFFMNSHESYLDYVDLSGELEQERTQCKVLDV